MLYRPKEGGRPSKSVACLRGIRLHNLYALMYSSVTAGGRDLQRRAADDQRLGEVAGLERPATVVLGEARRWARPPLRHPQARLQNPQHVQPNSKLQIFGWCDQRTDVCLWRCQGGHGLDPTSTSMMCKLLQSLFVCCLLLSMCFFRCLCPNFHVQVAK